MSHPILSWKALRLRLLFALLLLVFTQFLLHYTATAHTSIPRVWWAPPAIEVQIRR